MTAQNRSTLKAVFETGDVPDGTNYADLIDSFLNIVDTTAQSLASDLTVPTLVATTEVSSAQVNATEVSASVGSFATMTISGVVTADRVHASAATFSAVVSAGTIAAGTLNFDAIATALATASAVGGTGINVPTTAAGFITAQVCGRTVAIPFFEVT